MKIFFLFYFNYFLKTCLLIEIIFKPRFKSPNFLYYFQTQYRKIYNIFVFHFVKKCVTHL